MSQAGDIGVKAASAAPSGAKLAEDAVDDVAAVTGHARPEGVEPGPDRVPLRATSIVPRAVPDDP